MQRQVNQMPMLMIDERGSIIKRMNRACSINNRREVVRHITSKRTISQLHRNILSNTYNDRTRGMRELCIRKK